jgi:hypothetical protein
MNTVLVMALSFIDVVSPLVDRPRGETLYHMPLAAAATMPPSPAFLQTVFSDGAITINSQDRRKLPPAGVEGLPDLRAA